MKKLLFLILFICSNLFASTYYISPTGNDTSGNGSTGTPWLTFTKAFSVMVGGDTLILKDGTYTGGASDYLISQTHYPPFGTSGAYTIVKAEHDGGATIDGNGTYNYFSISNNPPQRNLYWQFEGIVYKGFDVSLYGSSYVKFLRCGDLDAGSGNVANFTAGGGTASYILFENCYAYGSGRYKFLIFNSTACVIRDCVARMDSVNDVSDPMGVYSMYGAQNVEIQNCIAIDSDQDASYTTDGELIGTFGNPTSGSAIYPTISTFTSCIAINCHVAGGTVGTGNEVTYKDCIWYGITTMGLSGNVFNFRGSTVTMNHCLIGNVSGYQNSVVSYYDDIQGSVFNSILYNCSAAGAALYSRIGSALTNNYDCYYSNILKLDGASQGANDTTTVSPIYSVVNSSGGIKYPIRVETGSSLSGIGLGGADIGPNCTKLIGVPGTLYGDSGYNTVQTTDMWNPFPNEDLIRTQMKAYNSGGVSGNRGFCADGTTLTKYIWEYLGNAMPGSTGTGYSNFLLRK